jgi:hypothetical protein
MSYNSGYANVFILLCDSVESGNNLLEFWMTPNTPLAGSVHVDQTTRQHIFYKTVDFVETCWTWNTKTCTRLSLQYCWYVRFYFNVWLLLWFSRTLPVTKFVQRGKRQSMINWKGFERKQWWSNRTSIPVLTRSDWEKVTRYSMLPE